MLWVFLIIVALIIGFVIAFFVVVSEVTGSSANEFDFDDDDGDDDEDLDGDGWKTRDDYLAEYSRPGFAEKGKWARFEYSDHNGNSSKRSVTMWERRGIYIVGYDRSRKEERTFRQDRISGWISG